MELIYHPAFDINHTVLRLLELTDSHPAKTLRFDHLRLLDFYFLFPAELNEIVMPRGLGSKPKISKHANKYNHVASPELFIKQVAGFHDTAVRFLIGKSLFDSESFKTSIVKRTITPIPKPLTDLIERLPPTEKELLSFLSTKLSQHPFVGKNGLKDRSGLMEHRYDAA